MFAHEEKVDMILVYGEAQKNARVTQRPDRKIFSRLEQNLRLNEMAFSIRKNRPIAMRVRTNNNTRQVL